MNKVAYEVQLGTLMDSAAGGALVDGHILVGSGSNVATDVAMSGDATIVNTGAITVSAVNGNTISHVIVAADEVTTVGGQAAEVIVATGALTTDMVFVQLKTVGSSPQTIVTAEITDTDELTVTFSADPDDDHVLAYQIVRSVA